jgi:hypothetical protein
MRYYRLVAALLVAAFALAALAVTSVRAQTVEQVKIFVSTVVDEAMGAALPPGVDEIVDVIENSPELIEGGLKVWLNGKMAETTMAALEAEERGDQAEHDRLMVKVDRYAAFLTCLTGDCTKLNQLKAAGAWPPTAGGASAQTQMPETPAASSSAPQGYLGDGDGPHFCCQWLHPALNSMTCSPAKNRALCESLAQGKAVDNADCIEVSPGVAGCKPR